ncbi:MAG: DUF86 domain-containing protein [Thermoplasmatota archaeon]
MKKDPKMFLQHIIDSIELIEDYTRNKDLEDFLDDKQLQDSVTRRIEIIGEAVKNLDHDIREEYPDVPWKDIAGMRDVIIHGYFGVEPIIVWRVKENDLPDLKLKIERILAEMESSRPSVHHYNDDKNNER